MKSEDWQMLKAKIEEMEHALHGLKALRNRPNAFPQSVLQALDDAITKSEHQLAALKSAIVN